MVENNKNSEREFLGDQPAITSSRSNQNLERRQISFRWLSGAILTGLASVFLMGGALLAALDGRQQLSIPAQAFKKKATDTDETASKGARPGLLLNAALPADSDILNVSTISRDGSRDVVKIKPFLHVISPLAIIPRAPVSYPNFDPLTIFSESGEAAAIASSSDLIYGADVEGEVTFTTEAFPYGSQQISLARRQNTNEIEETVRNLAAGLNIGATQLASISYFNNNRFSIEEEGNLGLSGVTITAENVSEISRTDNTIYNGTYYEERLARVRSRAPIHLILEAEGLGSAEANAISNAISSNLSTSTFNIEDRLRIFLERNNTTGLVTLARISVYRSGTHLVSIAKNEGGDYVYAQAPAPIPEISVSTKERPLLARTKLPTIYDAIYRASLSEGLTQELAKKLIKMVAFDVDFKGSITQTDSISVFVSLEKGQEKPTETSEILYASLKLGQRERRYYRYRNPETNTIDYYDETGKSAKQFLLREPVPNGRFRSPFGMRRHPITRVRRMHTGVDWSAPRGTPILAAGNATVEKAGWNSGGYGKQTILKHANGYKTSYNHQSRFAKGMKPGAKVRQGQVIGYVGSTGLSTGPHLHYEMFVNGNRVDPMRIKLPQGKSLAGVDLRNFEAERNRIDELLKEREEENKLLALN